jgi:hypothetical protein
MDAQPATYGRGEEERVDNLVRLDNTSGAVT